MRKLLDRAKKQVRSTDGSSMITVLAAFVILLLGIAGFSVAVRTSGDMIRRAEALNICVGEALKQFYPDYGDPPVDDSNYATAVKVRNADGTSGAEAFKIHGKLREKDYTVTFTDDGGGTSDRTYAIFYYKYKK